VLITVAPIILSLETQKFRTLIQNAELDAVTTPGGRRPEGSTDFFLKPESVMLK